MVARQQALTLGIEILRQRLESGFVDHQAWRRGRWAAASRCCTMAARRSARPSEKPANVGGRDMDWHSIAADRSEEHTSELQSLMRISYAVFCLQKIKTTK